MQGTIKRLVGDKNFGFIGTDGGAKDVFFHASSLQGCQFSDLNVGDAVTFEVGEGEKGFSAVNVSRA